ncbi:methyltransferase [Vibrio sp. SCSIO 43133]|uniref:methyltransferase n=1 Tax=Vibrio sp. SCSIO 43133 TaxID=2802577 RepID=UPI0020764BD2|nr:methyltransferase [Vibrio sp. SCSIO 43133]USD99848.1 methyltransferase [Vibrio sp. SCSIO 43133]
MKTELNLFERSYSLFRFPKLNNEQLQAWDAGDEYLIQNFEELKLPTGSNILILNDSFGALSCWASEQHKVTTISDSFISHQGIKHNLELNHCKPIDLRASTDEWPQQVDIVLMQIPRNNRYLTWQLNQIALKYRDNCSLIAVNKAKEIHSSTLKIFEKYAGHTTTSLAWKKHRLVFSDLNSVHQESIDPYTTWPVSEHKLVLSNLPNVYSGESLDLGARFILEHLKSNTKYQDIVDLGCGNGVLTLKLKQLNPQANITAIDESFMAVKSAHHNLTLNNLALDGCEFVANNCLDGFQANSQDLVVCNPPFHQQQAVTDHIAWQMFCDAKQVLRDTGELMVIGNRHLGYDKKLARLFGKHNVKLVASNAKFVILQATK